LAVTVAETVSFVKVCVVVAPQLPAASRPWTYTVCEPCVRALNCVPLIAAEPPSVGLSYAVGAPIAVPAPFAPTESTKNSAAVMLWLPVVVSLT